MADTTKARIFTRTKLDTILSLRETTCYRLIPACHRTAGVDVYYRHDGYCELRCHSCQEHMGLLDLAPCSKREGD